MFRLPVLIALTATGPVGAKDAVIGDPEWGEYLSGECVACHRDPGRAIPPIAGRDAAELVALMNTYKRKDRDNPTMQVIAGRLSDEEIAALAVYFASLDDKQAEEQ